MAKVFVPKVVTCVVVFGMLQTLIEISANQLDTLEPYVDYYRPSQTHRHVRDCQPITYGSVTHEVYPVHQPGSPDSRIMETKPFSIQLGSRNVKGHVSIINDPLHTISVLEPKQAGGCSNQQRATVAESAEQKDCVLAMNAGFFNMSTGACLGNVISNGILVQDSGGIQNAHFGVKKDGYLFFGYLSEDELGTSEATDFLQLVGGVVWLLRNGSLYLEESQKAECSESQNTGSFETFVSVTSARTAVGHDVKGRVLLVHVDGKTYQEGVNLWEMASIMKQFGAINAINTDGGGSASFVVNGTVVNYPSDDCINNQPFKCPRPVSTILCVHQSGCVLGCGSHGVCLGDKCNCTPPWTGPQCNELSCTSHQCNGRGMCSERGCTCNSGWTGDACQTQCSHDSWGPNCVLKCLCQHGGKCSPETGLCRCPPGYIGVRCEHLCPYGWYGLNCQNQCFCVDTCLCDPLTGLCNASTNASADSEITACFLDNAIKSHHLVKDQPEQYRKHNYEDFLCSLLLPTNTRAVAIAVRAFNVEIAQVEDIVSNRDIGRMRMQFWKDTIDKVFKGEPPQQPIALELTRILQRQKLTKRWFKRLIESREERLSGQPFSHMPSVEDYAESSVSPIYYLILEGAGIKDLEVDHAASHLGKALGITILLRGTQFHARRNKVYLPQDLMLKHRVSQEAILRGGKGDDVRNLIHEIATYAHQHIKMARSFRSKLPKDALAIFLPAISCGQYLDQLEHLEFDLFHPKFRTRNSWLPATLWYNKVCGRY